MINTHKVIITLPHTESKPHKCFFHDFTSCPWVSLSLLTLFLALSWLGALVLVTKPSLASLLNPLDLRFHLSLYGPHLVLPNSASLDTRALPYCHVFAHVFLRLLSLLSVLPIQQRPSSPRAGLPTSPSIMAHCTTLPQTSGRVGVSFAVTAWASLLSLSLHPLHWWGSTSLHTHLPSVLSAP